MNIYWQGNYIKVKEYLLLKVKKWKRNTVKRYLSRIQENSRGKHH